MPNWFDKQLNKNKETKSRYSFSVYGDIFVQEQDDKEQEKQQAEQVLIKKLPSGDGVRSNNHEVNPFESAF